jgi:putative PIN family toxin of toxin-antitoxin system
MKKVVFDTNILVSAMLIKNGIPAQILQHYQQFDLVLSEAIIAEVVRVLHYPHIQKRYAAQVQEADIQTYVKNLRRMGKIIKVQTTLSVVTDDPDDNKILACAQEGAATYLVTGDPDLLIIGEYQGVRILPPAQFLELLRQSTP